MTSARVTAFFGDPFQVEVYDNMDLEFIDHDIAYDQAAMEFGYAMTPQVEMLNAWREDPVAVALRYMLPADDTRVKGLALDFAEQIVSDNNIVVLKRTILIQLIKVGRKFQLHGGHLQQELRYAINSAREAANYAYIEWGERRSPIESDYAARVVRDALRVVEFDEHRPSELYYAVQVSEYARTCRRTQQYRIGNYGDDEERWQIRRFINVMNACQDGKPWPPLEATP